jgi:putative oxidoreductase
MRKHISARDWACLVLRVGLGCIMLAHGLQKVSVDGGTSWAPFMSPILQALVAWTEVVGGVAVLIGLFSRVAAAGFICVLLPALYLVSSNRGFIETDFGKAMSYLGVGYEYHVALILQCVAILLLGSGRLSVDHYLWPRLRGRKGAAAAQAAATPAGVNPPHFEPAPAPGQSAPGPRVQA